MEGIPIEELRSLDIFKETNEEVLKELSKIVIKQEFADNSEIFSEGSLGDTFYIVASGEVIIRKRLGSEQNAYKDLSFLGQGEFFGELSLIDTLKRSAQAVAHGKTLVYCIKQDDFKKLLLACPEMAVEQLFNFLRTMSQRLRLTNNHLIAIYEVGLLISREKEVDVLAKKILSRIVSLMDPSIKGVMALWNPFNEEFDVKAKVGGFDNEESLIKVITDKKFLDAFGKSGESVVVNEIINNSSLSEHQKNVLGECDSLLFSPMFDESRNISGFIVLFNSEKMRNFNSNHKIIVSTFSSLASLALINAGYVQEENSRNRLNIAKGMKHW
ncbi:MAG: cyclic nucleotide-binding domain-containing protein [bacterium]